MSIQMAVEQIITENELTHAQAVRLIRLQAWVMSVVCGLLALFAIAAATRIPGYLAASNYFDLVGVILFGLLALAGLVDNIRTHTCLWRLRK